MSVRVSTCPIVAIQLLGKYVPSATKNFWIRFFQRKVGYQFFLELRVFDADIIYINFEIINSIARS
jgi:hypothetical protein